MFLFLIYASCLTLLKTYHSVFSDIVVYELSSFSLHQFGLNIWSSNDILLTICFGKSQWWLSIDLFLDRQFSVSYPFQLFEILSWHHNKILSFYWDFMLQIMIFIWKCMQLSIFSIGHLAAFLSRLDVSFRLDSHVFLDLQLCHTLSFFKIWTVQSLVRV